MLGDQVVAVGQRAGVDAVGADVFTRSTGECAGQAVAGDEATGRDCIGQRRVGVAIDLALVRSRHRDRALADGECAVLLGDQVVAVGQRAGVDAVGADVFTRSTGECAGQAVAGDEATGRDCIGQRRVGVAIDLALVRSRHRDRALADGKVGAGEADVVVSVGQRALSDGIRGADVLARSPAQCTTEGVAAGQTSAAAVRFQCIGICRISIAIDLRLAAVGIDVDRSRIDRPIDGISSDKRVIRVTYRYTIVVRQAVDAYIRCRCRSAAPGYGSCRRGIRDAGSGRRIEIVAVAETRRLAIDAAATRRQSKKDACQAVNTAKKWVTTVDACVDLPDRCGVPSGP